MKRSVIFASVKPFNLLINGFDESVQGFLSEKSGSIFSTV